MAEPWMNICALLGLVGLFLFGYGYHRSSGVSSGTVWGITIELTPQQRAEHRRDRLLMIVGIVLFVAMVVPGFLAILFNLLDGSFLLSLLLIAGFFGAIIGGVWLANRQMLQGDNGTNAAVLGDLPYIRAVEAQLPQAKTFIINGEGIGLFDERDYCYSALYYEDYRLGRLYSVKEIAMVGLYFSQMHKEFAFKVDFDRSYTPGHTVTLYGPGGVSVGRTRGTYRSSFNSYVFYRVAPAATARAYAPTAPSYPSAGYTAPAAPAAAPAAAKFCAFCGTRSDASARFCPKCGNPMK